MYLSEKIEGDKHGYQVPLPLWKDQNWPVEVYKKYDLNGDGFITCDEMNAWQKKWGVAKIPGKPPLGMPEPRPKWGPPLVRIIVTLDTPQNRLAHDLVTALPPWMTQELVEALNEGNPAEVAAAIDHTLDAMEFLMDNLGADGFFWVP